MTHGPASSQPRSVSQNPRTGTELILTTKPFAKDKTVVSWWCIISTGLLLVAAMAGTIFIPYLSIRIVCSLLIGLLMLRFFVIYHDQQHHAILPKSKLAEALMQLFGILSLSPSSIWRSSHNHHHNHNSKIKGSHIGSFPIMTKDHFARSSKSERRIYLFMRHPLTILFGYVFVFLFGMCLRPFATKPAKHWDCLVALMVHATVAGLLLYYFGWLTLTLVILLPSLVTYAIGSYLFYAQHNFPGVSFFDKAGWTYEKAALESSSYMKTSRLMAWFSANIGYHHIHHLNAKIPFYRLPEVMEAIPELQSPKTTTLLPMDILRCLRLKVWDVERQCMVGLSRAEKRQPSTSLNS